MEPRRDQPNCGAVSTVSQWEQQKQRWERARQYAIRGYSSWRIAEICGIELDTAKFIKERYG